MRDFATRSIPVCCSLLQVQRWRKATGGVCCALVIALVAWAIKARKEEAWLQGEFGAQFDEHATYRVPPAPG
jgi:protein-S-isoprenylcysteine O-methyltransferase Ste14